MDEPRNTRRNLLVVAAVVALFVSAAGVVALAQGGGAEVFTGCLNQNSGVLDRVAIGHEPARPCNGQAVQITWDRAGPAFEGRIAELEEKVAELEEPFGTLDLFVDCDAGDTAGEAVAQAQDHLGPVFISVSGVCEEALVISRDDVTIGGAEPGAGFRAPSDSDVVVTLNATRNVTLFDLSISGGIGGLFANAGSLFTGESLVVEGTTIFGVGVDAGASGQMFGCTVTDNLLFGIVAFGGAVDIADCTIARNNVGALSGGGNVTVASSTIADNDQGVSAFGSGTASVTESVIERNRNGLDSQQSSNIDVRNSQIVDSTAIGVHIAAAGTVSMLDTIVEGTLGPGILVEQSSTLVMFHATIQNNRGDGITLTDLSNGLGDFEPFGADPSEIRDNDGWGINCDGPAAITSAQNGFEIGRIVFSGNSLGDTTCT